LLQIGPWPGVTEGADRWRPNPARGLTGGEGQVRGNVQGLTAVTGVAGVGEERGRGGGGSGDVDGVLVAGGQEGGGGVARKLPWDDVVLMVGLARAREQWIVRTTARPSGGGSSSSPA
jgi:hypothetical protein